MTPKATQLARTTALAGALAGALGTAGAAQVAQEYVTGGIQLSFGVGLGVEAQSNRTLARSDPGSSFEVGTDLTFGVLTETRNQRLFFELGGRLRGLDTPTTDAEGNGFVRPSLRFEYSRNSANARLSLRAQVSERDVSEVETLEVDFIDIILASGNATRRSAFAEARFDWGLQNPFGFGVFARAVDTSYSDGLAIGIGGTNLFDNRRLTLGATARFDLTPAATLRTALSFETFEQDDTPGERDTISLDNTLTIDRPLGALTLGFDIDRTEDGERVATRVGRAYEMPWGNLSGELGVTRGVGGDTFLTGAVNAAYPLPRGLLNAGLTRSVSSGNEEDTERVNTQLSLGYLQEIDPSSRLQFGFDWAEVEQTATGDSNTNATLSATYTRELTTDWNMDMGVRHRFADDNVSGSANSNEVFFNLRRTFLTRF